MTDDGGLRPIYRNVGSGQMHFGNEINNYNLKFENKQSNTLAIIHIVISKNIFFILNKEMWRNIFLKYVPGCHP